MMSTMEMIDELARIKEARAGLRSLQRDHNPPHGFGYVKENEGLTYALALMATRERELEIKLGITVIL